MSLKKSEINVSLEDVKKLFNKIDESILEFNMLDDDASFCNPIYFIKSKSGKEYVLKVINPLKKWQEKKTINEVMTMKFIRENTSVPVPKIYDFSFSSDLIGYEYILMEKISGNNLKNVFEKNKKNYLEQIAFFVKEFQRFSYNKIGGFDIKGDVNFDSDLEAGPFNSFKEFIVASIEQRLKQMNNTEFEKYVLRFRGFCEKFEDVDLPICFCHMDLCPKNMIEKDGKILGLIDFEWAGAYPYVCDSINFVEDFSLNNEEKKFFYDELEKQGVIYKMTDKVKDIKHIEILAMILVSYKDWFLNKEDEAQKYIEEQQRILLELFKKYDV